MAHVLQHVAKIHSSELALVATAKNGAATATNAETPAGRPAD